MKGIEDIPVEKKFLVKVILLFLLVLPIFLAGVYIALFGVNVVFWDQWALVPLLDKMFSGNSITLQELFAQHNEHRIFFPRIIMLILAYLSHWNNIAEMYFSLLLLTGTWFLILKMYIDDINLTEEICIKAIISFIPISWLLFSFRQWENLLWGWQITIMLSTFSFILAIYMLEKSNYLDLRFVTAIVAGVVSSYSYINGLLTWPCGFVYLWLTKKYKKTKCILPIWLLLSVITFVLYFHNWVHPKYHPPLTYILRHPVSALHYFFVVVGSPLAVEIWAATSIGILTIILVSFVFYYLARNRNRDFTLRNSKWYCLIVFSLLSAMMMCVGRAGFGVFQALSSRYTTITMFTFVGLYFTINNINHEDLKKLLKGIIISILFLGIITGYIVGIETGKNIKEFRTKISYYLLGYENTNENFLKNLYSNPKIIKEWAKILERYRLNVFYKCNILYKPSFIKVLPQQLFVTGAGEINHEIKFILYEHPLTKGRSLIIFKNVSIPPHAKLKFSIALDPAVWDPSKGDGVTFEVFIKCNGKEEKVFSKYIDPKHNPEERKWNDYEVDLSKYANKNVTIIFSTLPGPNNDSRWDWAWWGEPRIEVYK